MCEWPPGILLAALAPQTEQSGNVKSGDVYNFKGENQLPFVQNGREKAVLAANEFLYPLGVQTIVDIYQNAQKAHDDTLSGVPRPVLHDVLQSSECLHHESIQGGNSIDSGQYQFNQ